MCRNLEGLKYVRERLALLLDEVDRYIRGIEEDEKKSSD